ncbi:RND efflux system, outer membrane lipoprotein, NodT family [Syntrophobacter sp. SbD1]|nr:RND efflux system, outer membrane lipoprotein, NodT family [Syntrophobacter sp. SbD1]
MATKPKNKHRKVGRLPICGFLPGAVACFCLAACTVGPNYHPPVTKVLDGFIAVSAEQKPAEDTVNNKPVVDAANWWKTLDDKELDSLIDRAIQNNPDLEIALDRLQEARTSEIVVLGQALPVAGVGAGGGGGTGSDVARGRVAPPLAAADNTKGTSEITDVYGFDFGWEIDLFGKIRRGMEAAAYDTQATVAARNVVLISVIADVARAYIDMRALQMQLAVLQKNTDVAMDYFNLTRERFERGITNELDLTLAKRQLASLEAEKAPLIAQVHATQYIIAVLVGVFPEDLAKELEKPEMVPQLPEKIDAGIPLDLLRRRPDIQQAERQLAGATARIGVATADLFPHLLLTGATGYQAQGFGVRPELVKSIWSIGPSIEMPLLDFGTLDAVVDVADLRSRELLVNYRRTVLNAVREVDTSVDTYTGQLDRLRNLSDALAASQRSVSLATERYDRGLTDSLNVIDAERQEYVLEQQYVSSQQSAAEQFVALYKALGGGWEQYQSLPPIRVPEPAVLAAFTRLLRPTNPPQDMPN